MEEAIHPVRATVAGKAMPTPLQHIRAKFLSPKLYSCGTFTARMGVTSQWRGQVGFSWNIHTPCIIIGKAQCLYQLIARLLHEQSPLDVAPKLMAAGAYAPGGSIQQGPGKDILSGKYWAREEEVGWSSSSYTDAGHWELEGRVGHISQATHWFQP